MKKIDSKILIVEDQSLIALALKRTVIKLGYLVTGCASSYKDALLKIEKEKPHLILMDINLNEDKDGIDLAEEINKIDKIPIIYISAYTDEETIERAIKTDPVGYLNKPYNDNVLKSTIMLGLHKAKSSNSHFNSDSEEYITIDKNYRYNFMKKSLYYDDYLIQMGNKENKLLKLLLDKKGQIVTFEEIENTLWGDNVISSSTMRTLIHRLRSKLDFKLIETVHNQGCKLVIDDNLILK